MISSLMFSFGMYAAMLPIVTQLYHQTPLYSVVLNMIVLPFMPLVLGLGLIGGLAGLFFMPLAEILLMLCHFIIYFYEMVSMFVRGLPFSEIVVGHHSLIAVVVYYLVLFAVIYGIDFIVEKRRLPFKMFSPVQPGSWV